MLVKCVQSFSLRFYCSCFARVQGGRLSVNIGLMFKVIATTHTLRIIIIVIWIMRCGDVDNESDRFIALNILDSNIKVEGYR
jgi:hypothetical protein